MVDLPMNSALRSTQISNLRAEAGQGTVARCRTHTRHAASLRSGLIPLDDSDNPWQRRSVSVALLRRSIGLPPGVTDRLQWILK